MASCLLLFYSTSLYTVYGGTDGGAKEEAKSQFTLRAKCAKYEPTFADKLIIHQNLQLVTISSLPPLMFHLWWCRVSNGMSVYSESPRRSAILPRWLFIIEDSKQSPMTQKNNKKIRESQIKKALVISRCSGDHYQMPDEDLDLLQSYADSEATVNDLRQQALLKYTKTPFTYGR